MEKVVDCAFVSGVQLLVSTKLLPPKLVSCDTGKYLGSIPLPLNVTARTPYGRVFSRGSGDWYLRTSYPFELIELDGESFHAKKRVAAESLSNLVLHPQRPQFASVIDFAAQAAAFGSFECTPAFYEYSIDELPYIYSIGLSNSGNSLHVVGNDGENTVHQKIDMSTLNTIHCNPLQLSIENTAQLKGNDSNRYVTADYVPVIGEDTVFLFRSTGEAIISSISNQVSLPITPHKTSVISIAQTASGSTIASLDWDGVLGVWKPIDFIEPKATCNWGFFQSDQLVSSTYLTKPRSILKN